MLKQLRTIIVVNIIIVLLFVYADYSIGNIFNEHPESLFYVRWGLLSIQTVLAGSFENGDWIAVGAVGDRINFPFLLFFVSIVVNLLFIIKLVRENESKQKPTQRS